MSYISVDLKAIEVFAPAVSRATGRPVQEVLGGLVLLWHRCWSSKSTVITPIGVAGCFGPVNLEITIEALVDSEFLSGGPKEFEVRGADKYLRVSEGRSLGGKKALEAGNLLRGTKKTPKTTAGQVFPSWLPADLQLASSSPPAGFQLTSQLAPSLSPNTEHRVLKETLSETSDMFGVAEIPTEKPAAKSLEEKMSDEVFQVWAHWKEIHSHPTAKPSPKRIRIITESLKNYSVEELQDAIEGIRFSPHHMGENDRKTVYDDLELILRDHKNIEKFRDLARKNCR